MSITLKFTNPNSMDRTMIEVYRADYGTDIPDEPSTVPILTGDGYTNLFVDHDVIEGELYNYRFVVYVPGGDRAISNQFTVTATSLYCIGNQDTPDYGNQSLWWYPTDNYGILPSMEELMVYSGATEDDFLGWTDTWHKVSIAGEIYFIASKGYIRITDKDKLWQLYTGNDLSFSRPGYNFTFDQNLAPTISCTVLDPFLRNDDGYNPDYRWANMVGAVAELDGVAENNVLVVYGKQGDGSMVTVRSPGTGFTRPATFYPVSTMPNYANWYWKPIVKFIPIPGGNV